MIKDYCIIHLSVTDLEVQCYYVPPVFDNEKTANAPDNFNHYWKMKVMVILNQMYSEKEYIEVVLTGVDLLQDLGIKAIDHKARINKSNRPNIWITEINAWEKSRIDYYYRLDSWKCYVKQIDEIRRCSSNLVFDAISCFDFLYKKQYFNKERFSKLKADINNMKQLLLNHKLLPKTVVDPYCLFREDMQSPLFTTMQNETISQSLSFNTYSEFRKFFDNTYRKLELFCNQFADVLSARFRRQNLNNINNPRLPLINLFDSAKSLFAMQKEYGSLFSRYRTIDIDFENKEIEGMLILLNVWSYIFEHPIRGYAIAYEARQLYRKSSAIIEQAFEEALKLVNGEAQTINCKTYIVVNFDPFSGSTLESAYKNVVLTLRNALKSARPYNSVRWYFETQFAELIYVPAYKEIPLFGGFQIPKYKILDVSEDEISKTMFPVELPTSLYVKLGVAFEELKEWQLAAGYLGAIKMQITQYNDVIGTFSTSEAKCESGLAQYLNILSNQLSEMITKFSNTITLPLKTLELVTDNDVVGGIEIINNVLDDMKTIDKEIAKRQKIDGLQSKIDGAIGYMLLLQPHILKGAKIIMSDNSA
jgi:hypothetical protein